MKGPILTGQLLLHLLLTPLAAAYEQLSDNSLKDIPGAGDDFDISTGQLLAPILIPRVPGTPGSQKVQDHFVNFFARQLPDWSIIWHNTTAKTPATGDEDVPFRNIIFRRDPPWAAEGDVSRLTLVAHYDSLFRPEGFIGATDSAAPCALLMHVARSIDGGLTKKWSEMTARGETGGGLEEEKGVQIILLDGEEAWVSWTETDSLYGARALAADWEAEVHPQSSIHPTPLKSISLFVLLDLLGAPTPRIPSYFQNTHWAYQNMAKVEKRLRKLDLLQAQQSKPFLVEAEKPSTAFTQGYILDDHVPFMNRGVDILHVIPTPFPSVWHTMEDDGEHLDVEVLQDWAKIITAFTAEWMELEGFLPSALEKKPKVEEVVKDEL
ncbi:hypothetical protein MCOR25_005088 [Pyricularia grisea]|uniref:Peptide hydrolase n=1 Tax=Pyricularia grisea TaxID=148305 RepID=A0A6P8BF81_PYRGI|nr:uncharacterized protein PgNI_00300 [Pyricularia grisea]KAI6366722.1 hypothetical protein MCOR25_005088 [Pyricularia grisea]TLD15481.1 hypothetical protein PgNI_00300 [Pyricularia grisea]